MTQPTLFDAASMRSFNAPEIVNAAFATEAKVRQPRGDEKATSGTEKMSRAMREGRG